MLHGKWLFLCPFDRQGRCVLIPIVFGGMPLSVLPSVRITADPSCFHAALWWQSRVLQSLRCGREGVLFKALWTRGPCTEARHFAGWGNGRCCGLQTGWACVRRGAHCEGQPSWGVAGQLWRIQVCLWRQLCRCYVNRHLKCNHVCFFNPLK